MLFHKKLRAFRADDEAACLALFDVNCPEYFASNERTDYREFLAPVPAGYRVCVEGAQLIGAYGLILREPGRATLNWILIDPRRQRAGIGSALMGEALSTARAFGISRIDIAASHRSASFFASFGAIGGQVQPDGWGPGMHRIDMILEVS